MAPTLRLLLAALAALTAAATIDLALVRQVLQRPYDVVHVPRGAVAGPASLGQRGLVSDLYWLSAVQYIGDPASEQRGYAQLLPLLELVTDLDPRHGYAYQTGGIVLSAANRLEESDRIMEKGMTVGPNWWTYPFYRAFNDWFYRGDTAAAAPWAERAARTPGASPNISHLAVALASKSHNPELAIQLITELRREVKDEATAARLDEQYKLAVLERDAQALERAVQEHEQRTGHPLTSLDELLRSGELARLPADPFGGHYVWRAAEREVQSSANPFRFRTRNRAIGPRFKYQPPQPSAPGTGSTK
jgi:hypothetical protein